MYLFLLKYANKNLRCKINYIFLQFFKNENKNIPVHIGFSLKHYATMYFLRL